MTYLLDTNVVSEVRRRRGEPRVRAWLESVAPEQLFLSVIVVGEIRRGVDRLRVRDPAQAAVFSGGWGSSAAVTATASSRSTSRSPTDGAASTPATRYQWRTA